MDEDRLCRSIDCRHSHSNRDAHRERQRGCGYASYISAEEEGSALVSNPDPAYPDRPSFSIETIQLSCKSDVYRGTDYSYADVIIYSCDRKSKWQTANGTWCKSGYLVIMDTSTKKVTKYKEKSSGLVHGAVYRSAFGEEYTERDVNSEGFSVMNRKFKINSGVFNPAQDGYHDNERSMYHLSAGCIKKVVDKWMEAAEHFYGSRNLMVKDL